MSTFIFLHLYECRILQIVLFESCFIACHKFICAYIRGFQRFQQSFPPKSCLTIANVRKIFTNSIILTFAQIYVILHKWWFWRGIEVVITGLTRNFRAAWSFRPPEILDFKGFSKSKIEYFSVFSPAFLSKNFLS